MPHRVLNSIPRAGLLLLVVTCVLGGNAVLAQDAGAPPWGEFLRRFDKDRLLKPPFHMDPEEGVKGLASKIRARELDVKNRKRAIRYLSDLDCRVFPEAKQMLLEQLDPKKEKWEEVRFAAAKGLRDMFARNACADDAGGNGSQQCQECRSGGNCQGNCQACRGGGDCQDCGDGCNDCGEACQSSPSVWQRCCNVANRCRTSVSRKKDKKSDRTASCHCTTCCDADTLNKLAKTAYELTQEGCCYEPSLRVREMAVKAISVCGIPCNYAPYYATGAEQGPGPVEEQGSQNDGHGENVPPVLREEVPNGDAGGDSTQILLPITPNVTAVTPISRLKNLCIVSLKHGKQLPTDPAFTAAYRGRLYYFASAEAQSEFDEQPEQYAVAFGGCDPVHYLQTRQAIEGRYLTQHDGRFYMFASRENADIFKASPAKYSGKSGKPSQLTVSR
jgi:YHS domain-containing protein